jgi:signal peptidase I
MTVVAAVILQLGLMTGGAHSAPACLPLGARAFSIPSTSMAPTLQINEYVLALESAEVSRGDVVTYLLPKDQRTIYIKRIVGLPGERVQMVGGVLHINDVPVVQKRLDDTVLQNYGDKPRPVRQWLETLPGGRSHRILDEVDNGFLDNTAEYTVPAGHYFMMGDNRDNSSDSRLITQHGPVPAANILCRPEFVYFSMQEGESVWRFWRWPRSVRWDRLFSWVD